MFLQNLGDIQFQKVEKEVDPNCWLFTFSSKKQAAILDALKANQIIARPFWMPMNQLPMFQDNVYINKEDHSRSVHANSLSIPSSVNLTETQLAEVVKTIKSVFKSPILK